MGANDSDHHIAVNNGDGGYADVGTSRANASTMLQEANHRIANSLAIATAMLEIQQRRVDDDIARDALIDTRLRLDAIANLHRLLAVDDSTIHVAMDEYFPKVLFGVQKLWSRPDGYRDLQLTCDRLDMEPQQALSVTVIAIELITNSCKYAYPAQSRGVVGITLLKNGVERFELTVTDKGMGKQARIRSPGGGLGALIIAKMVQSMRALMTESSSSEGTTVTISGSCYKPNT